MNEDYDLKRKKRLQKACNQQRQASDPRSSVWVSASAGTGKTRVLSDRVLRLLLKKINPSKILCLTYTKAAAAEMKNRIFERLSEWVIMNDEDLERDLYGLLDDEIKTKEDLENNKKAARTCLAELLDVLCDIKIQTIHSFCQEILKRFPLEAEIFPNFDIIEEQECKEILKVLQNRIQYEAEISPDTPLSNALRYLNVRLDENSFPQVMKSIIEKRTEIADLLCRCNNSINLTKLLQQRLNIDPKDSSESLMAEFMKGINCEIIKKYLPQWKAGENQSDKDNSSAMELILKRGFSPKYFNDYCKIFTGRSVANANLQRKEPPFKNWIETEKERVNEYKQRIMRQNLYESTINVLIVASEFINRYEDYKYRTGKMDYTDLILVTRCLLQKSSMADWVLFKLDGGIKHILVDEAQDTSPLQWDIIQTLCAEFWSGDGINLDSTIFAVGDRKQSIFSFQGADPNRYDIMANAAKIGKNHFKKIDLEVSFRSAPAILDVVNRIFSTQEMAKGVVSYGEKVNHIAYRVGEFGDVQIWPFIIKPKDSKNEKTAELPSLKPQGITSIKKQMAEKIVSEIIHLMDESKGSAQQLHYRDFMILVQRRKSIVTELIRACKVRNIPITGADKLILSKEIAVQDLLSLGKFLLLPEDDLSLAEILKSPLFGLNDDDLTQLCYNRGNNSLWCKLLQKSALNDNYKNIATTLQNLLNKLDFVRPFELYNEVLTTMNGRYLMTARMGTEVEDILDEFMSLTLSFEKENIPTLQGFINWIEQTDIEIKREVDRDNIDAVRIMTVHHSKGLQAPVVFLADAGFTKNFNQGYGLFIDDVVAYYPLNKDDFDDNCERILEQEKDKDLAESKRLLYVALTRAEDRLYICGFQNGNYKKAAENSWYNMCLLNLVDEKGQIPSEEKLWQYTSQEIIKKKNKNRKGLLLERQPIEDWVNMPIPERELLSKPYTPSKLIDEDDLDSSSPLENMGNYYRRGTIIHKLLQFLPQTTGDKETIILEFLKHNAQNMSFEQHRQISNEILNLLNNPEYIEIFSSNAYSEVPIMGVVDDKFISAKLDKLVILPQKIMIVDFKTNQMIASSIRTIPKAYIKQLQAYSKLVKHIYPNHHIEAYILWTNIPRLMRVI